MSLPNDRRNVNNFLLFLRHKRRSPNSICNAIRQFIVLVFHLLSKGFLLLGETLLLGDAARLGVRPRVRSSWHESGACGCCRLSLQPRKDCQGWWCLAVYSRAPFVEYDSGKHDYQGLDWHHRDVQTNQWCRKGQQPSHSIRAILPSVWHRKGSIWTGLTHNRFSRSGISFSFVPSNYTWQ